MQEGVVLLEYWMMVSHHHQLSCRSREKKKIISCLEHMGCEKKLVQYFQSGAHSPCEFGKSIQYLARCFLLLTITLHDGMNVTL